MQYGLNFQEERFTEPFITDWVLDRVFHERADEVRREYLERIDDERYRMKPEVNTQRKIEARFAGVTRQEDLWLRDGLYSLVSDVLFVRDRNRADMFHPRISAQLDFIYESLYDNDKQEEAAQACTGNPYACVCRGPWHGARLRAMGDERTENIQS